MKVKIELVVKTPKDSKLSAKKVAKLVDRLIAIGVEEANDSVNDVEEYDSDAEVVLDFDVGKAKGTDLSILGCKRCGTNLDKKGYCKDETCPHSDHLQKETWVEG